MSDKEIRQIILERKRSERRKMKRREQAYEFVEGFIGWSCLLAICFMLSVIGG